MVVGALAFSGGVDYGDWRDWPPVSNILYSGMSERCVSGEQMAITVRVWGAHMLVAFTPSLMACMQHRHAPMPTSDDTMLCCVVDASSACQAGSGWDSFVRLVGVTLSGSQLSQSHCVLERM